MKGRIFKSNRCGMEMQDVLVNKRLALIQIEPLRNGNRHVVLYMLALEDSNRTVAEWKLAAGRVFILHGDEIQIEPLRNGNLPPDGKPDLHQIQIEPLRNGNVRAGQLV